MKFFLLIISAISFFSCEKAKEKAKEELIIDEITRGQWKVTNFLNGSNNVTADFNAYSFQFKSNKTVDAIKNGSVEQNGTWDGNSTTGTITSHFNNPTYPLVLLNGTWTITDAGDNFVEAKQTVNGEVRNLRLERL